MKIFINFGCIIFLFALNTHAQKPKSGYGKINKEEITMSQYPEDPTANAVILSDQVFTYYKYKQDGFKIYSEHTTRIKILSQEGTEYANIILPYYSGKNISAKSDWITQIKANSYNMDNGKIEKTEMDKKYIFEERISPYWKQIKFSIPNVKSGSVIEYQYVKISDFFHLLPDIHMQFDIPVMKGYYEVRIPYFYDFNISYKKNFPVEIEEKMIRESANIENKLTQSSSGLTYNSRQVIFKSKNMPALKEESYSWCKDDFRASIGFELKGIQMPQTEYKPYTSTWEEIDKELLKDEDFGQHLELANPFIQELQDKRLTALSSKTEKIQEGFRILKSKMVWNENYRLYPENIRKAVQTGSGSNAEMNFILLSILRDLGIKAYPILISRREKGRLPMIYPTISKLNTFIVGAEDSDSTMIFLDASMDVNNINILPATCMVENGRMLNKYGESSWINLTKTGKNFVLLYNKVKLSEDNILTGHLTTRLHGQYAAAYRREMKSLQENQEKYESRYEIKISDLQSTGADIPMNGITEIYSFQKEISANGDYLYVNPLIFPHILKNPFTQEERQLPVEMNYPYTFRITNILEIPDIYRIEELPKSGKFTFSDNSISATYSVTHNENIINVNYAFALNQIFFQKESYKDLSNFFASIANKNNELIILRKR